MANKKIFASANHNTRRAAMSDTPKTVNAAGGLAYRQSDVDALVQMVVTGTFRDGFYTTGSSQLNEMASLLQRVPTEFIAKLAIYGRRQAFMKDTPAFLLAWLSKHDKELFEVCFPHVVNDGKMLKNFVQIIRSGVVGKKSLGSQAKRLVANWLVTADASRILSASIGSAPSLADVIRLSHPRPADVTQAAMLGWVLGRAEVDEAHLPQEVRELVEYRRARSLNAGASRSVMGDLPLPKVPFMLLTSLDLDVHGWAQVARRATWQQLRMNLNTFARHGVFDAYPDVLVDACNRLADAQAIEKSMVTPHQLLAAVLHLEAGKHEAALKSALFKAIELACGNVPTWEGKDVAVFLDVSGSMTQPVTGGQGDKNASKITCAQAGALFAAVVKRRNPNATIISFDGSARKLDINGYQSLEAIYNSIRFTAGSTNCAAPVEYLQRHRIHADYCVMMSDNESHKAWVNYRNRGTTGLSAAWGEYQRIAPKSKLVCIDFAPNTSVQVPDMHDVLNVGGFTDDVFRVADRFFTQGVRSTKEVKDTKTLAADIHAIDLQKLAA